MAIMELYCELWHMSSTDEVTARLVTEFEPESVIYNIEDYNRNIYWSAHCHDLEKFQGTKYFISINQIH